MGAVGQAFHQQQRQRGGAHGVEAEHEDGARNGGDGCVHRAAVEHGVGDAQDLLGQGDVGQHVVGQVFGALIIR